MIHGEQLGAESCAYQRNGGGRGSGHPADTLIGNAVAWSLSL